MLQKSAPFEWGRVGFVIPCFNDGELLNKVLPLIPASSWKIIVDDGSYPNIDSFANVDKMRMITLRHITNLGQGAALETGLALLRKHGDSLGVDIVVTFDSDGQHQIEDVTSMIFELEKQNVDIVLGSRFLNQKSNTFAGGWVKYLVLRCSSLIARMTIGLKLTDRHNGLRVLNQKALNSISISQNGYGHADEFLREIKRNNLKYCECQVTILYPQFNNKRGQTLMNGFNIVFRRFFGAK